VNNEEEYWIYMKICIIDDLVSNTDVIAKFLKLKGHETVVANSGKKGLLLLEDEIFDAVILDVTMPDMSGIEIVDALNESGRIKDQNILIFSASLVDEEKINDLKDHGVKDFIKKPIDLNLMLSKLEEAVKS